MKEQYDFIPPEDEEIPSKLQQKWDHEDNKPKIKKICPHCKRPIPEESFSCFFCGEKVFEKSGFLGALYNLFQKKWTAIIVIITVLIFVVAFII